MKQLDKNKKYEARVIADTVPEDWDLLDITLDKWYPIEVESHRVPMTYFRFPDDKGFQRQTHSETSMALGNGSWEIREVGS